MKIRNASWLLLLVISFFACSSNSQNELVGKWEIEGILIDPVGGATEYTNSNSGKIIEFREDGTFVSNGFTCGPFDGKGKKHEGVYDLEKKSFFTNNCKVKTQNTSFELKDGKLLIHFDCIEQCIEKYVRKE